MTITTPNPLWQRLEFLRPSLPRHVDFQRRDYNNELWYLLHDKSNGHFHRLTPSAYRLISFMNGRHSLQQILTAASAPEFYESVEEIPTAEELIQLLQYLHVADLLVCDFPPSTQELFSRQQRAQKQKWLRLLMNPLAWKFSLGNPDKLLTRLLPLARLLATPTMGIIWLLVVSYAVLQAGNHWSELSAGKLDKILSPSNLFLIWLIYPLLKIVHELGHGLFTKVWGGNVHECGVIFILATPLPFVDASAATGFKFKTRRLMVSAAGMAVELFIAALALLFWLNMEQGLTRDILYNIMLIGGVSTLFFNGNPLMRYDGYHLLTDVFDLPNLASRANQQVSYLVRRYGYGLQGLIAPAASRKEAIFFTSYSLAAFTYRLFMLGLIILMVANYFPSLGLLLAIWLLGFQLFLPTLKYFQFLFRSKLLQKTRKRALSIVGGSIFLLLIFFIAIPMPFFTSVEGVVWLPDAARVKAESSGEITQVLVSDGAQVPQGQILFQLTNISLTEELAYKQASLREYTTRLQQAWQDDRGQAQLLEQDVNAINAEVESLQTRVAHLIIRSPSAGRFRSIKNYELLGSYLHQGDSLGIIETSEPLRIRAALTQEEIGSVRQATNDVQVRLASNPALAFSAQVSQQVPAATFDLPSMVLGAKGGGRLAIDATKADGLKTAQMVFLVDVNLQESTLERPTPEGRFGERAYVRFYHPATPLSFQLYRLLQQLFIRSFQQ